MNGNNMEQRSFNEEAAECHEIAAAHGFWPAAGPYYALCNKEPANVDRDLVLAKIALIMSELGEAVEAVREENLGNLDEELVDVIIRTFDLAGSLSLDMDSAYVHKMEKNRHRIFMHGKKA
jgi:NTP pyrophosphatase (non-canonical NTP hydrolase)